MTPGVVAKVALWLRRSPAAPGAFALAVGLLVYLSDRAPAHASLIPAGWSIAASTGPLFGAVAGWLPSFVHPFAFSLFTAATLPRTSRPALWVCLMWWAIDVVFEVLQHPLLAAPVADTLQQLPGMATTARYFAAGTFDPADLLAATAGAVAAAWLLRRHASQGVRHEA